MPATLPQFRQHLELLPVPARRLLCLIAQQADHGPLRSKEAGTATMPELYEACGLDVDRMYSLLQVLRESELITIEGAYPFEEIKLAPGTQFNAILRSCVAAGIPIETVIVDLRFDLVTISE